MTARSTPRASTRPADLALAEILRAFADRLFSSSDGMAGVAVTVTREERFTNIAAAGGMTLRLDEPAEFGGAGSAFDPAEALLAAVGASLSVTLTAHAALRSLSIAEVKVTLAAKIDGHGFFEPRSHPRAGLLDAEIDVRIVSDETPHDLRALFAEARRACPALRSLKRSPKIALTLERTDASC